MTDTVLTREQRAALAYLRSSNAGAIYFAGRWVWPEDIRQDTTLAAQLELKKGGTQ